MVFTFFQQGATVFRIKRFALIIEPGQAEAATVIDDVAVKADAPSRRFSETQDASAKSRLAAT